MGSRRFVTLSLLCAHLGCSHAARSQIVSNDIVQTPSQPRTISGVVINSVTGRPVPRALVQAGEDATLTDGEGRFEFSHVTGDPIAGAMKPGYFLDDAAAAGSWSAASQSEDRPLELRLVPEAILSGRVTDSQGSPIEGVTVMLHALMVRSGLKHWEQRLSTTTNTEGEFRFAELQAGTYSIRTALRPDGPADGDAAVGYAPGEYPEIGANGSGRLQVHAGDQLQAEVSTRLERLYPVSGMVTGLPGNSWFNVTVHTAGGTDFNSFLRQDPRTGEFRMLLPSGSYELRVQAFQQEPIHTGETRAGETKVFYRPRTPSTQLAARQQVTVASGPVSGVRVTLQPMATIALEVAEERTAHAQSNDRFVPPGEPAPMNFSLLPADADAPQMVYQAERIDGQAGDQVAPDHRLPSDGPLLIHNLPPGHYFLQAQGPPPWHVAAASCGGTDLTREPLAITGAGGCTMRVVVRDDGASLKVSVSDAGETRAAHAFIYAVPLSNLTREVQTFLTGTDGKVFLDGLPPGPYLLLATRHGTELDFRDPESLQRYETEGSRVDLAPGASTELHVDLITGEP